jgi:heme A synthase
MQKLSVPQSPQSTAVRCWLIGVAALIALMVLVGGATRLTESGLSIVEWKPVTGSLPPLTDAQWHEAFEGYKQIPQYRELNAGMTLAQFKTIFWWEWSHRLLGRFIGVAYLLPFLYFLWRFRPDAANRSIPVSARRASDAGAGDFRRHCLDGAADERAAGNHGSAAAKTVQPAAAWIDVPADLFRRTGRGPARGARLQYMA